MADDGRMFLPDPVPAKALIAAGKLHFGPMRWWPLHAGIAASGDLGFTVGAAILGEDSHARYTHFFTIWKRQADGRWRWVMDSGVDAAARPLSGPGTAIVTLVSRHPTRGSWREVAAAEASLARGLAADAPAAMKKALSPDARLLREGPPPAFGASAIAAALAAGPTRIEVAPLGGAVSAAGDLAYTYGSAAWAEAGGVRRGHYVRVWQRRGRGWSLLVDEIAAPPLRPPPPG
jgi:ketosteroid isomerase-like protein